MALDFAETLTSGRKIQFVYKNIKIQKKKQLINYKEIVFEM